MANLAKISQNLTKYAWSAGSATTTVHVCAASHVQSLCVSIIVVVYNPLWSWPSSSIWLSTCGTFMHVMPLHWPHAGVHCRPLLRHVHVFLSHLPLQLHRMIFCWLGHSDRLKTQQKKLSNPNPQVPYCFHATPAPDDTCACYVRRLHHLSVEASLESRILQK